MVRALTPIVHERVARLLLKNWSSKQGFDLRQEIEDRVQDVFVFLLSEGGKRLLAWDPNRGSARTFFGLLVHRHVLNILQSPKKNPTREQPTELSTFDQITSSEANLHNQTEQRELIEQLGQKVYGELNQRDKKLFMMLFIEKRDDDTVRQALNMKRDALYQARRRLLTRVRKLARDIYPDCQLHSGVGS